MEKKLTLATLADGAAVAAVDNAIHECLQNIANPSTDPCKPRVVTLTIKIQPNEERNMGKVTFQAKSKLAPTQEMEMQVLFEKNGEGKVEAFEYYPEVQI